MNNKINLEREWIELITQCIYNKIADAQIFIFGSRVKDANRKYSDVDIAIKADKKIDYSILSAIQDNLEESNIPYTVDIVDFNTVPSEILDDRVSL